MRLFVFDDLRPGPVSPVGSYQEPPRVVSSVPVLSSFAESSSLLQHAYVERLILERLHSERLPAMRPPHGGRCEEYFEIPRERSAGYFEIPLLLPLLPALILSAFR